jgi:Rrf2 family protein
MGMVAAMGECTNVKSESIAESVGTNAVVVRRIIGSLVKHGLIEVQMGSGGGSRITRPPGEITLAEIYLSLDEGSLFQVPILEETHCCKLGIVVRPVISDILLEAENDLLKRLESITLADMMSRVQARISNQMVTKEI